MNSLKASIPALSEILRLNPHALYERQRALVSAGLLESKPGRGPGSGVPFSAETVAILLISMLATDGIAGAAEVTSALSDAGLRTHSLGQENTFGGARTFKSAIVHAFSNDGIVEKIKLLRVHRCGFVVEVFTENQSSSDSDDDYLHLFGPKRKRADLTEGMTVVVELRGGTHTDRGIENNALTKIRELLRSEETVVTKTASKRKAARASKAKDQRK